MIELFGTDCFISRPLWEGEEEEVTLLSCIEGHMGRLWVDVMEKPNCAFALVGDFCYIIGCYNKSEEKNIIEILMEHCQGKIIMIDAKQWEPMLSLLKEEFPERFKTFTRYALFGKLEWFDQAKLQEYATAIEPEFHAVRIDEKIYPITQEQFWTADFCSNFITQQDFKEHGIGYVILKDNEIIAGASTYSYCEGKLEITIETKEEYRKKGLALACASKIILECLERNIFPRWDAANMASVALAEKLGYRFNHEYTVYMI